MKIKVYENVSGVRTHKLSNTTLVSALPADTSAASNATRSLTMARKVSSINATAAPWTSRSIKSVGRLWTARHTRSFRFYHHHHTVTRAIKATLTILTSTRIITHRKILVIGPMKMWLWNRHCVTPRTLLRLRYASTTDKEATSDSWSACHCSLMSIASNVQRGIQIFTRLWCKSVSLPDGMFSRSHRRKISVNTKGRVLQRARSVCAVFWDNCMLIVS